MNVIIIENEAETIALIKDFIYELGIKNIILANDAIQGIQKLRNQQFDLIFINEELIAERTDIDVVSLLKKLSLNGLSKTILTTKYTDKENIESFIKKGFKCIVTKPIADQVLKEKIQKIIT